MSAHASVVISPMTTTRPDVTAVSHATRAAGSWLIRASSTASDTWSQSLSGCPSVTDSDVSRIDGDVIKVVDIETPCVVRAPPAMCAHRAPGDGASAAGALRATFPRREIRFLFGRERVDADSHRDQFQPRNFAVDLLRHIVDADGDAALVEDQVLDRERLVGEGHIHHAGGVPFRRRQIDQPTLGEQEYLAAV